MPCSLSHLTLQKTHPATQKHAVAALVALCTAGERDNQSVAVESGALPVLTTMLAHPNEAIASSALVAIHLCTVGGSGRGGGGGGGGGKSRHSHLLTLQAANPIVGIVGQLRAAAGGLPRTKLHLLRVLQLMARYGWAPLYTLHLSTPLYTSLRVPLYASLFASLFAFLN